MHFQLKQDTTSIKILKQKSVRYQFNEKCTKQLRSTYVNQLLLLRFSKLNGNDDAQTIESIGELNVICCHCFINSS